LLTGLPREAEVEVSDVEDIRTISFVRPPAAGFRLAAAFSRERQCAGSLPIGASPQFRATGPGLPLVPERGRGAAALPLGSGLACIGAIRIGREETRASNSRQPSRERNRQSGLMAGA